MSGIMFMALATCVTGAEMNCATVPWCRQQHAGLISTFSLSKLISLLVHQRDLETTHTQLKNSTMCTLCLTVRKQVDQGFTHQGSLAY